MSWLYKTEMSHELVRQLLVDFVSNNKPNFQAFCHGNMEQHLGRMKYQRCWGTAVEILAAASLLQMPIYTYTPDKHSKYRWMCYKPLVESALNWFPDEPYPKQAEEMNHIELLHLMAATMTA